MKSPRFLLGLAATAVDPMYGDGGTNARPGLKFHRSRAQALSLSPNHLL